MGRGMTGRCEKEGWRLYVDRHVDRKKVWLKRVGEDGDSAKNIWSTPC